MNQTDLALPGAVRLRSELAQRQEICSYDELRVLRVILRRLELGRTRYGYLDLSRDRRDFKRERAEEYVDAAIYDACDELARADERQQRERCEAHDRAHARLEPALAELRDADALITSPHDRFDTSEVSK